MSEQNDNRPAFNIEDSVTIKPVHMADLDYNDLQSGLNYLRRQIHGSNGRQRKICEEQFCYFVRELEVRQTNNR